MGSEYERGTFLAFLGETKPRDRTAPGKSPALAEGYARTRGREMGRRGDRELPVAEAPGGCRVSMGHGEREPNGD